MSQRPILLFLLALLVAAALPGAAAAQGSARVGVSVTVRPPLDVVHGAVQVTRGGGGSAELVGALTVGGGVPAVIVVEGSAEGPRAGVEGTVRPVAAPGAPEVRQEGVPPSWRYAATLRVPPGSREEGDGAVPVRYVVSMLN